MNKKADSNTWNRLLIKWVIGLFCFYAGNFEKLKLFLITRNEIVAVGIGFANFIRLIYQRAILING